MHARSSRRASFAFYRPSESKRDVSRGLFVCFFFLRRRDVYYYLGPNRRSAAAFKTCVRKTPFGPYVYIHGSKISPTRSLREYRHSLLREFYPYQLLRELDTFSRLMSVARGRRAAKNKKRIRNIQKRPGGGGDRVTRSRRNSVLRTTAEVALGVENRKQA